MSNHKHIIRRFCLIVLPIIISIATAFCFPVADKLSNNDFIELNKVIIGIDGTLLGFIITAVSILVAFTGSQLTEEVKQTQHYKTILFIYLVTCFQLLVAIIFGVFILLVKQITLLMCNLFIMMALLSAIYVCLCLFFLCLIVYTIFK